MFAVATKHLNDAEKMKQIEMLGLESWGDVRQKQTTKIDKTLTLVYHDVIVIFMYDLENYMC